MKRSKRFIYLLTVLLFVAFSGFSAVKIDAIRVEKLDETELDSAFIEAYVTIKPGQKFKDNAALSEAISEDVDTLNKSGRFSYVRAVVDKDGDKLAVVYNVSPRLRLSGIDVVGTDKMSGKKIRKEMELELGEYVDQGIAAEKARIAEDYCREKKFANATVTGELVPDDDGETARLVLTVDEGGGKLRVKSIRFVGDRIKKEGHVAFITRMAPSRILKEDIKEEFDQSELKKLLQQKTVFLFTPWGGTYKPEVVDADRKAVREYFMDHGYLDAKVENPEMEQLGDVNVELIYKVDAGDYYKMGTVDYDGITLFSEEDVTNQVRLKSGDIAGRSAINSAASAVEHYYGNRGYIDNKVNPVITKDSTSHVADVLFKIKEGQQVTISEINIVGNKQTKDEVIRRELAVLPGEKYHEQKVEVSKNRLKNLNYFSDVNETHTKSETTEDACDLTFKVKEKSMGSAMFGVGFSSVDDLVGYAEISHGNFDIRHWPPVGDGQKARLRVQLGTERTDVEFSYIEPWFLDRRLSAGVDLYSRSASYYSDYFDLETLGGRFSLTKGLTPFIRAKTYYSLENYKVTDVESDAPTEIEEAKGTYLKSTFGLTLSRDTRNNFYLPSRGNRTAATAEVAEGFLGEVETYYLSLKSSHFFPLWNEHVLNIRGEARYVESYGSDDVPIFDRLFLGGPNSLRGFEYRDVSPRSDDDDSDEPIGGNSSYYVTAEYIVPLWDKIRGVAFYDLGAVDSGGLNSDFGVGLRFDFPGFPLRLDYGFPHITDDDNDDASGRWNFSIGYSF